MSAKQWNRWVARVLRQSRRGRRSPGWQTLQVETLEERVTPATFIWTGLGGNNLWSNPANWAGGVAPTSAANPDLVFNTITPRLNTNNDIAGLVVRSITVSASNYTLGGNPIQLAGNIFIGTNTTNVRITLSPTFTTAVSITVNNLSDLTISGVISGGSTAVLTKLGAGTLTLSGNNAAYAAPIDIQNGRLVMTHVNALGTTTAATVVNTNAQLQVRNVTAAIAEPLIINGPGVSNDGALFNAAGNTTWTGTITLDSNASIGVAAATTLNVPGLVTDTGSGRDLTKVGAGQLIFSRTGGNTYRGLTIINDGILTIRDPQSLGGGSIFGAPENGTPRARTIVNFNPVTGEAGTLQIDFDPTVLAVGDPNGILRDPTQPYNSTTNPYIGFQVFNDLLELNGPGFNNLGALNNNRGQNIWNGDVRLGSPLPNTSDVHIGVAANSELTISGILSDDPGRSGPDIPTLIKTLPGRLILDNANTYRGQTEVRAGALQIRDSNALGPSTGGSVTVFNGAALEMAVDSGLDGTPQRSKGRNLGFDSVTYNGPGQEIVVNGSSDTFTLTFNGASTPALPVGASAATVQAALNSLSTVSGVGGSFTVTQNGNVYRALYGGTFNDPLNPIPIPLMTVTTTGAATAAVNPIYGLSVNKQLQLNGRGINNSGALRSISGRNEWIGTINIGSGTPFAAIGVDPDSRPGHPTADFSYRIYDYGLTIPGANTISSSPNEPFIKVGAGHLQLPTQQTSIQGPTNIEQGWITIGQNDSLGPRIVLSSAGDTAQPNVVTVYAGAALHLLPTSGSIDLANRRLILSGEGINHPFAMLNQGALLSLGGNNVISGDVFLRYSPAAPRVGIGVDDPIMSNPPNASTLTITGSMADDPLLPAVGADLVKMGSRLLRLQGDGTYSGNVEVRSGTLRVQHDTALGRAGSGTINTPSTQTFTQTRTTVQPGARLELDEPIPQNNGGVIAGLQIWDEWLILNDPGQQVAVYGNYGSFTLTFNGQTTTPLPYGVTAADMEAALNTLSSIGGVGGHVTVTQSGNVYTIVFGGTLKGQSLPLMTAAAIPAPGNLTVTVSGASTPLGVLSQDNAWRGPVTLAADTIFDIADNSRLSIYGRIDDAPNPAASGSSLWVGLPGTGNTGALVLAGNNTYRGTTIVQQGVLTIAHNRALGGVGQSEQQTVTLGGSSSGTFTLTFDGHTTAALPFAATAAEVADALNALPSIGGVGGQVSVSRSGNVLTITFDGSLAGADQPQLTAAGTDGTTATVATIRDGYGGTIVRPNAQLQIRGSLTVAGESLILHGNGPGAADAPTAIPARWFSLGPGPANNGQTAGNNAVTGRITGVTVDPSDPNVIYVSTAGGGAWKTKNGGLTWLPLFDNNAPMFSGAIAVAPSNPRVVYFGTGAPNFFNDSFYGTGVYKSTDSGRTWTLLTNPDGSNPLVGQAVTRIVVDPADENRIYVATTILAENGNPTPPAGVWRYDSTQTWVNLTTIVSTTRAGSPPTPNTGFPTTPPNTPGPDDDFRIRFVNVAWTDLYLGRSVDAFGNPVQALFAAHGKPDGDTQSNSYDNSSRTSNAVYRLLDPHLAGTPSTTHWFIGDGNPVNASGEHAYSQGGSNPFPTGNTSHGVIRLAGYTPPFPDPSTLYAMIVNRINGALLEMRKSTDGGRNWNAAITQPPNMLQNLGWRNNAIAVDPANPNIVAVGGTATTTNTTHVFLSVDGGGSWIDISIDGAGNGPRSGGHGMSFDSQGRLVYVTDGGVWRYEWSANPAAGNWRNLNGGQQATTLITSVATHPTNPDLLLASTQDNGLHRYVASQVWQRTDLDSSGQVLFNPTNPNIAYHIRSQSFFGLFELVRSNDAGQTWPDVLLLVLSLDTPRFAVDPLNSSRIVIGADGVRESLDGGNSWTSLNGPSGIIDVAIAQYQGPYQPDSDFPLVDDVLADTYVPETIYAATSNDLFVTKNRGVTWVNRTAGLPVGSGRTIQSILVDPRNRDTVYVVLQANVGSGNAVYRSTDAGRNWDDVTYNLPDIPFWRLTIDPRDGMLYLGTDDGVWRLPQGSNNWQQLGTGLPRVQVREIELNMFQNTLTAATYGRGVWQFYLDEPAADSGALRVLSGSSAWTGPVRLAGPTTITVGADTPPQRGSIVPTLDIVGPVSDLSYGGNSTLTKSATGDLKLSGANTYGGLTDILAGTLTVNNPQALGQSTAPTFVRTNAALQMKTDLQAETVQLFGHGTPGGLNGHNTGALRNISGNNTFTGTLVLNSHTTIGVESGTQLTIGTKDGLSGTGTITGNFNLDKELTGTLILSSNNTGFSGVLTAYQGALRLEHSQALGTGSARIFDGAQLQLNTPTSGPNAGVPVVVNNHLAVSGTGIFGTGAILNLNGNNAWNGPILFHSLPGFSPPTTPPNYVSINVLNSADTLEINGNITETTSMGLRKIGGGILSLRNDNTHSGLNNVLQGTLNIQHPRALGNASNPVTVAVGASLELLDSAGSGFTVDNHPLTLAGGSGVGGLGALRNVAGSNTWNGPVQMLADTTVWASAGTALTLAGGVAATGLTFNKIGPGTVIFPAGSPPNTQLLTRIFDGTVQVNGTIGNVRLSGGTISGTGTVGTIVSDVPAPGSTVSPGATFPTEQIGTLTSSGATLHSSNIFFVHLSNSGTPTNDQLNLTGNINLGGATLAGITDGNVALGDRFTIIQTTGTVSGRFAGPTTTPTMSGASAATIAFIGGRKFVVNYFTNQVVLEADLATTTMSLAGTETNPVYGRPGVFVASFTPEHPSLAVSGNVVFTVVDPNGTTFSFTVPIDPLTKSATWDPATTWPNGFGGPLEVGLYRISASYNGLNQSGQQTYVPVSVGPINVNVSSASTTTTLTSSHPSGAEYGVPVTFTATVTSAVSSPVPNTQSPEGTVSFYDGATLLGTANLTPSGFVTATATFTVTNLSVGSHTIVAVYNGDGAPPNYTGSSNFLIQTISKATTTTVLSSSPNPSNYGQSVTLTATVSASSGGTPTGIVTFRLGSTILGISSLSASGVATLTTTPFQLPGGTLTLTATYEGSGTFAPSTGSHTHTVNSVSSSTTLAAAPNPSVFGQLVTFTATVTPGILGGATPSGTVVFRLGSTVLGTATLNASGVATYTTTVGQLPAGTHTVTADYLGDGTYDPSSATVTQVVNAANTRTVLTVSPTRVVALQAVRLQAVVSAVSPGGGTPAGPVTFTDTTTGRTLGTATLVNGVATLWSHLGRPLGTHSIRATYSGSSDHNPSASTLASVTVIANGTRSSTVVLRSSLNPSNVGTPVTFTATVRDVDGSRTPTGTVAFYANGTVVGYGVLGRVRDGLSRATFTTDTLPVGLHTIVARYSGSSVYARSVSSPLTQDVRPPASRTSSVNLAVTPSSPTVYGQPLTLTATVTDTGSGAPITPTGTVVFYSHGVEVGRGSLSTVSAGLAQASITVTSLNVGTHDLQAEYLGDIEFVGGVLSGIVTHQVDAVASTVSVSSSPSPARFGGAFDLVATVRPVAPSVGIPTGQVIFTDISGSEAVVLGTATLDGSGVARLRVSSWGVGVYRIVAEYLGDGNVLGSTGSGTVEVAPAATRVALSRSTTAAGQRLVIRARVTAVPPGGGVPSGVVQFYINGVLRGSGVLDSTGVAQLVLPGGLPVGVHVVRAVYVGDGNYLGSSVTESWGFGLGRNV